MLTVVTNITINQTLPYSSGAGKATIARAKNISFDFCHSFEASDSWAELTNKGKIVMPKNLYVKDPTTGKPVSLATYPGGPPSNINIGGFATNSNGLQLPPLLMKGDRVTINAGYKYFKQTGNQYCSVNTLFTGFISRVTSKKPLEFEVEDNMWLLKQIPVPVHTFKSTDTLQYMLQFMLGQIPGSNPNATKVLSTFGVTLTVNALATTTFGEFRIGNENMSDVLERLRKQYLIESYFRGNDLRSGPLVYVASDIKNNPPVFQFQNNIISDELEYTRRDDIVVSTIAHNTIEQNSNGTTPTKDGKQKTIKSRLEVLVTINTDGTITSQPKPAQGDYPVNITGSDSVRKDSFFITATSVGQLSVLGAIYLKKYYYTGFKGKFTTFGLPYVKQGDNIQLVDNILPERNGLYKVKRVDYSGGVNGLRQVITLDYRVDGASLTLTAQEQQVLNEVGISYANI